MTLKYAPAKWRPIPRNFTDRKRSETRGVILHTTASTAASQFGWFSSPKAAASSHLHVALDGTVEQYVDLDKIAWTSGAASGTTVGIETAGTGKESWTPAQVEAITAFLVWACKRWDIPARAMTSSLASERGIGWHRLGIDGNFPALPSLLAGRNQRGKGESWSKSTGKVCPGDKRIQQIPGIVAEVQKRLAPKWAKKIVTRKAWLRETPGGKKVRTVPKCTKFLAERGSRTTVKGIPWIKTRTGFWIAATKTKGRK